MSASEHQTEILIASFFSGSITLEDKKKLEAWVQAGPANKKRYLQLKNIWEASHPAFPPSEIDTEAARDKIIRRLEKAAPR